MPRQSIELLLLRHAKSSWADEGMADHDRPLNARGIAAASRMGRLCRELDLVPDRILTSDACRTRETVAGLTEASGFDGSTTSTPTLYLASPESILETVRELGGDARRLLVVAHNPGMQTLMSRLASTSIDCPTATLSVFRIPDADLTAWGDWSGDAATHLGTWRPKELPPASTA
ncbi:MAG: phosphohistidine phosphatase [Phycisphaerae bacterium]|nr:phosphohistidine phosphatase [Phycisphaerae bacterium]